MSRPSAPIAGKSSSFICMLLGRRQSPDDHSVAVDAAYFYGNAGFDEAAVRYDIDATAVDLRNARGPQRREGLADASQPAVVALRSRDVAEVCRHAGLEHELPPERQAGQHPREHQHARHGQQDRYGDASERSDYD